MTYIENVFFCLAAPMLVAVCCTDGARRRSLVFMLAGMVACLFSSYVSSFLVMVYETDLRAATVEIAPMVEETMKLLPVLFYLIVFEPKRKLAAAEALMVAVGFATLENACYLLLNGADDTLRLLIRGFSTGAMHVACGAITALGLSGSWDRLPLRVAGSLGALCMAFTWHGIYNMLVAQPGAAAFVGYALPLLTGAATILARRRFIPREA